MKSQIHLFLTFLIQGATSFGGPAAGLTALESEYVQRRAWISSERFRALLTWCKLLPGPVATQLGIMIGRERAGTVGGILAGIGFISPAFILVLSLLLLGRTVSDSPTALLLTQGMTVSAFAHIAVASFDLGKAQIKTRSAVFWMLLSAVFCFYLPRYEPLWVIGAGLTGALRTPGPKLLEHAPRDGEKRKVAPLVFLYLAFGVTVILLSFASHMPPRIALASTCFRIATLTFGTGMVVLPLLQSEFVDTRGWSTEADFAQALAFGQITPGPIVITATALGFSNSGILGALVCTLGMFLPSFFNALLLVPEVDKQIRDRSRLEAFIRSAMPWIIGSILGAAAKLAFPILSNGFTALSGTYLIALGIAALRIRKHRAPPWLLIPLGGVIYTLLSTVSSLPT